MHFILFYFTQQHPAINKLFYNLQSQLFSIQFIFNLLILMAQNYDDLYKIILAGDAYVGKTNLVYRYVKTNNENTKNIAPTVGVEFSSKMVKLADNKRIKAQIWDTAGQQQYRSITAAHYRKALGALVVYDITKYESFQNVKKWIDGIKEHASANVVIVMVGNKLDLKKNSEQVVTTNQGKKMANSLGVLFAQTSALTNENVEATFSMMLEEIEKRKKQETASSDSKGFQLSRGETTNESEKCC